MSETTGTALCFIQYCYFFQNGLLMAGYHHLRDAFAVLNNEWLGRQID